MKRYKIVVARATGVSAGPVETTVDAQESDYGDWIKLSDVRTLLEWIQEHDDGYYQTCGEYARDLLEELQ